MEDRRLVVDTSIIRGAGEFKQTPQWKVMQAIEESDLRLVRSTALAAEWVKHLEMMQHRYSRTWVQNMKQRGRIDDVGDVTDGHLRGQLRALYPDPAVDGSWPIVEKDTHLVEAALIGGMRILASDEKVRGHLRRASATVGVIAAILWANPSLPTDETLEWITAGAPREPHRQLDPTA